MTFFIALSPDHLTKILLLVFLGGYLFWGILRDYRLVSHWEYKIWDMRRGADREGMESEINRMRDDGVNFLQDFLIVPPDKIAEVMTEINEANEAASPFGRPGP